MLKEADEAFILLNTLLEGKAYAAGDELTIADFCLITCVATLDFYVRVDESKYPNLAAWFKKIKRLPCYGVSESGLENYKKLVTERLKQ